MPALAALLAALGPIISRLLMAKTALWFAGFLGRLGLVIATNEIAIEPLINLVVNAWSSLPADYRCMIDALGATKVASLLVSASGWIGAKKVFFSKS